jgi:hypothetical protein
MRVLTFTAVIVFINGLVGLGFAENQDSKEEKRFSNETSLSVVSTTGNTDSLTLAGKNDMRYKFSDK